MFVFFLFVSFFQDTKKITEVLDNSYAAFGGRDAYYSLQSIYAKGFEYQNFIEQSERPQGPYIVGFSEFELWKSISKNVKKQIINNKTYDFKSEVREDENIAANNFSGRYSYSEKDLIFETKLLPENILKTLEENIKSASIRDTLLQDVAHLILNFKLPSGSVNIFFNRFTYLPSGVSLRSTFKEGFLDMWGKVNKTLMFSYWDYQKSLHYPKQIDTYIDGIHYSSKTYQELRLNAELVLDSIRIPDSERPKLVKIKTDLSKRTKVINYLTDFTIIAGAWYSSYFKTKKGIYIIEAPISSAYSEFILNKVKSTYPTEKILGVFTTSDAFPHFAGLREYSANKIPIFSLDLNIKNVEKLLNADYSDQKDLLFEKKEKKDIKSIAKKMEFNDENYSFSVYPIRSETGERMMMIYFPNQKLLYASDLIQKQHDGSFFMPQYLTEINDLVEKEQLVVETVFAMHLAPTPYKDIVQAIIKAGE